MRHHFVTGLLIASANGAIGMEAGIDVLRAGGSALDAAIACVRLVEASPQDHTVGYSGLPNLLGEVELDASVMVGEGLRAGAVGALTGFQDAADLARRVMDELPHVLLAGGGAARFASEVGMEPCDLLTEEARAIWRSRIEAPPDDDREAYFTRMREIVGRTASDPDLAGTGDPPHGTVNVIARDRTGRIASAVSTSGWAWKYPGRLGDSPIIGAGNFADDRWGAAACTGRGEMAQRACTAHSVVTFMRFGMVLDEALTLAIEDLSALDDPYASELNIVAIDRHGMPGAVSTEPGKSYVVMSEDMVQPDMRERRHVPMSVGTA